MKRKWWIINEVKKQWNEINDKFNAYSKKMSFEKSSDRLWRKAKNYKENKFGLMIEPRILSGNLRTSLGNKLRIIK